MIKRKDIIKEFELAVKQEIKNYQDSLNTILQRLNFLNDDIRGVEKDFLDGHAALHSQLKSIGIENEKFKININTNQQKTSSFLAEQNKKIESLIKDIEDLHISQGYLNEKLSDNLKKILACQESIKEIKNDNIKNQKHFNNEITSLEFKSKSIISKSIDELKLTPSECDKKYDELNEKINSYVLDVKGLLQELRFFRHDIIVIEKKIENIYTLIGRLQKKDIKP